MIHLRMSRASRTEYPPLQARVSYPPLTPEEIMGMQSPLEEFVAGMMRWLNTAENTRRSAQALSRVEKKRVNRLLDGYYRACGLLPRAKVHTPKAPQLLHKGRKP